MKTGKFPEFPSAEEGGSKKIFAPADASGAVAEENEKPKSAKNAKGSSKDDKKKSKKKGEGKKWRI